MHQIPKDRKCLIGLDFDGTLVEIAKTPNAVVVPDTLPILLNDLVNMGHQVFIITGRSRLDVMQRILPASTAVIGLHGLEWPDAPETVSHPLIRQTVEQLRVLKNKFPDMLFEDKNHIVAVHFRGMKQNKKKQLIEQTASIFSSIVEQATALGIGEFEILPGQEILELRPKQASKGLAMEKLIQQFSDYFPIYIGDDTTDEDAFSVVHNKGLAIHVTQKTKHHLANDRLGGVQDVYRFLEGLCYTRAVS